MKCSDINSIPEAGLQRNHKKASLSQEKKPLKVLKHQVKQKKVAGSSDKKVIASRSRRVYCCKRLFQAEDNR